MQSCSCSCSFNKEHVPYGKGKRDDKENKKAVNMMLIKQDACVSYLVSIFLA